VIRVQRTDEPDCLPAIRDRHLERLRKLIEDTKTDPDAKQIGQAYGHADVRKALYQLQNGKCGYCEKEVEDTVEPLDHYRPKTRAWRHDGCKKDHGYWWLAFTWENLVYACSQCNSKKSCHFPLAIGSTSLVAEEVPQGDEIPLLLDPMTDNGVAHIEFVLDKRENREIWIPQPRNDSPRGRWSIEIYDLKRDGLIKQYTAHVQSKVMPTVRNIQKNLSNASNILDKSLARAQARLLSPAQRFVGLSYDALVHYTGAELAQLNRAWPMPK
jgi:uncharacterized protein (TIGR02646 family)